MLRKYFIIIIVLVFGFYLNVSVSADVLEEQNTRLKIVEKVLESSLVDLKKSALEVAQRNQFLLNENKNLEVKTQELEKELKSLQGEKTPLSGTDENSGGTPAYQKLQVSSLQEQITRLSEEKNILEKESWKAQEENKIKQEDLEKIGQSNADKVEEMNQLRQQFNSLKAAPESSERQGLREEKKRLLFAITEKKEKIEKLQRKKLKSGSKKDYSKGMDDWREKQGQLKQEVLKLEKGLSVISEDERQYLNQISKIEQSRGAQLVQLNQEMDSLTSRKQELERTLVTAQEKLKTSPLNFASESQSLESLEEKLNSLRQENQALSAQISSSEGAQ